MAVYARDSFTCQGCLADLRNGSRSPSVVHLDGNIYNDSITNLALLCGHCRMNLRYGNMRKIKVKNVKIEEDGYPLPEPEVEQKVFFSGI